MEPSGRFLDWGDEWEMVEIWGGVASNLRAYFKNIPNE
jgi:hypothetical protein